MITEVDGVAVGSDRELQKQILGKRVGATVQLTVIRKGKTMKVPVTTGELPMTTARNGNPAAEDAEARSRAAGERAAVWDAAPRVEPGTGR